MSMSLPRQIRVFVSSTFRDMQDERDYLVKFVFPRLRKLCDLRSVVWGEVDLRWGITDEQSSEGRVLPICLEQIERCRPYFICLLGERYGSLPDFIAPELIEKEPWLEKHRDRSVTELEIIHAVLNDPSMADYALFYFRDSEYIKGVDPNHLSEFTEDPRPEEIAKLGADDAQKAAEDRRAKLVELKTQIRESGLPLRENYRDQRQLGEWLLEDMTTIIEKLYPEGSQLEPLQLEAMEHESFAASRTGIYIEKKQYLDQLDAHAASAGREPLVVLGESGMGKSALLANWVRKYRSENNEPVFVHFIGATAKSTDWTHMLYRIMAELRKSFSLGVEIPHEPDRLRAEFPKWLQMAANNGKIIIILDALDRLEDRQGARELTWLPPTIPDNIRLVLSTLPGKTLDVIEERNWPSLTIEPLDLTERTQLLRDYLGQYAKQLNPEQVKHIVTIDLFANPLALRMILEELRQFGVHDQLDNFINRYRTANSIIEIFELILERCEVDFEVNRPGLVRDALSFIWAGRRGLSEAEVLDLLGEEGEPLPQRIWVPLFLALEQSFLNRGGFYGFFHDYIRQAVERRYLATEETRNEAYAVLADYFDRFKDNFSRRIEELPWQLARSAQWRRLYELLSDLDFFQALFKANRYDILTYWAAVEAGSEYSKLDAYRQVTEDPSGLDQRTINWLAYLFQSTGHMTEAMKLRKEEERISRRLDNPSILAAALGNQGAILHTRGRLDEAIELHQEAERIHRSEGNTNGLCLSLLNQALILTDQGQLEKAMEMNEEAEKLIYSSSDMDSLQACLGQKGAVLYLWGQLDEAIALYADQERICRQTGNLEGLQSCLGSKALVLGDRGNLDEAMTLYKEMEQICRSIGKLDGLSKSLANQADILQDKGQFEEAATLAYEMKSISERLNNPANLGVILGIQANLFYKQGRLEEALALLEEQEEVFQQLGNVAGIAGVQGDRADILNVQGLPEEAMALHKKEEQIYRRLNYLDGLGKSLLGQADIFRLWGRLDEALALIDEVEKIYSGFRKLSGIGAALGSKANILVEMGRLEEAMTIHREHEKICRRLGKPLHLQACLANQGRIYVQQGRYEEAMKLYKEQEQICRRLGYLNGLGASLGLQAEVLRFWGKMDEALALSRGKEKICRQIGNQEGLAVSLGIQAELLMALGRLDEAMVLIKEKEEICRRLNSLDGLQNTLHIKALILQNRGLLDEALVFLREQECLCRRIGKQGALGSSLGSQGVILFNQGKLEEALALHREHEIICRRINDLDGLQVCLGNQANTLHTMGNLKEAWSLHKEEEEICRRLNNLDGLQACLGNQGAILLTWGRLEESLALQREKEEICRCLNNNYGLCSALANQAAVHAELGERDKQEKLLREALALAEQHGYMGRVQKIKKLLNLVSHQPVLPRLSIQLKVVHICIGTNITLSEDDQNNIIHYAISRCRKENEMFDRLFEEIREKEIPIERSVASLPFAENEKIAEETRELFFKHHQDLAGKDKPSILMNFEFKEGHIVAVFFVFI